MESLSSGNIYGYYPAFQTGEKEEHEYDDGVLWAVSESRITSGVIFDYSIDPSGKTENLQFSFEDGYLNVKGRYTEEGGAGVEDDRYRLPFSARFKVNVDNRFPYQLVSAQFD